MKKLFFLLLITMVILFSPIIALACSFNTDCQPGSKCLKASGSLYGVCVGGISPGNSNDREPAQFFPDINKTHGNTCSFDVDCGPGKKCVKSGGIQGTCL